MTSKLRHCAINPNKFCYICGEYIFEDQRKSITEHVRRLYFTYFKLEIRNQDKAWVPHSVCKMCVEHLRQWEKGTRKSLKFGVPMIWKEQRNHNDDCYFCMTNIVGINKNTRHKWKYPNISSARRPIPHSENVPVPVFQELDQLPQCQEESTEIEEARPIEESDDEYCGETSSNPEPFSQNELNDLIRDLDLSKERAELLASRLKEKKCLASDVKISAYRTRERDLLPFFSNDENLVYCNNVSGLMKFMGLEIYKANDWRLFIDSSKRSLKGVLLHNGNKYASIPIAYSTCIKEQYQEIAALLPKIKYSEHKWVICVDLKMLNFLLGQQSGHTKYPCFMCLWDSRAKSRHWTQKHWPVRDALVVGEQNVINEPLVSREKIILPPLHIKLGLIKQYVKALDKKSQCFQFIGRKFPGLSSEKLKAGIFDGPQIRRLIKDSANFESSMTQVEQLAWKSFVAVTQNFLGNKKAANYVELVDEMLERFRDLGCNMSIKLHYLHSHIDHFQHNLGDLSDEQGERFHQDLKTMESRYQGRWDDHMLADYCWGLMRDCPSQLHRRKSLKRQFCHVDR